MSASPLRVLAAAGLAAAASAASRMLVNQSEAYAIYDSVGTTVVGGNPFFAFADGLNPPAFADLFDGTSGSLVWSFTNASGTTGTPTFLVDTARHCEPSSGPDSAADVFVAVFDGAGASVYGLSSAAATAAPLWAVSLPGCGENIEGGTYIMMEASDSGNRVAIQCHHAGTPATARVYSIAGQTGIVEWSYDLGTSVQAGQGNVQVTTDGAFVLFVNEQGTPTPNTASAFVLDGATGALRAPAVIIPFFICAAISDDGLYLAVGDDPAVHVFAWDSASSTYKASFDVNPPPGVGAIPWDVQMSAGPDADEMLVVGYIAGDVKSVQIAAWSIASQTLVVNWNSKTNTQLQENPTIRADGNYIGVSLWGDVGEAGYPTIVLLQKGSNATVFEYVTPGSMSAVDINVVTTGGVDTIYLAAGGKHVPANQFGNGGDAFAFAITP